MVWGAVAVMGINAIAGMEKSKQQAKALLADSKLQRIRLEHIRERTSEAYFDNIANVDRTEMDNAFRIEEARLTAQSDLQSATAGSGITGISVDELSVEVAVDAAEAHNDNVRGADETKGDLFKQRLNTLEDLQFDIDGMPQFDAQGAATGAILSGVASGLGAMDFGGGFKPITKDPVTSGGVGSTSTAKPASNSFVKKFHAGI